MKLNYKIILVVFTLFITKSLSAQTYTVDTPNFTETFGVYSQDFNIVGTFTTNVIITPNSGFVDIKDNIVSYVFSDGVQMLDQTNSSILFFSVQVNEMNQVTASGITIWRAPVTTVPGGNVGGMDVYLGSQITQVFGFLDGECFDNSGPGGQCMGASYTQTNSGSYFYIDEVFRNGFELF